ncbi:MAG TPA: hypothetical protein VGB63_08110 [Pedobacter sp.]|jgi:hypothetical protein
MKFIIALLLTALLSFIFSAFSPWWIIAVVAFIVAAAIPQKSRFSFLSAALALFLLWGIQAFVIDNKNDHILAKRIANLLIHRDWYLLVIFITAFLGSLVAGFAAISGSFLRKTLSNS